MITKKEKQFEEFVRGLPKLNPRAFMRLASFLGVRTYKEEIDLEKVKDKDLNYIAQMLKENTLVADEILEKMMDRFLELRKGDRAKVLKLMRKVAEINGGEN